MHQVITSPQHKQFVVARQGARGGMRIPEAFYDELATAATSESRVPTWLVEGAQTAWGLELRGQYAQNAILVRPRTALAYARATWEINKGCNFNCEHCYLAQRRFEGLSWPDKVRLLDMLRDAGVLWLQITGGEPTIDRHFLNAYVHAHEHGMMLEILTNGSRLQQPALIDTFSRFPPQRITVSLYGASEETAGALTRTPRAFRTVLNGLRAAAAAGVPVDLALIITKHNAHEVDAMREIAHRYGRSFKEYANISPTYDGGPNPLATQSPEFLDRSKPFSGCTAGHEFFHVDPHGLATMCKVGRENPVDLMHLGLDGLRRLPAIADAQMLRTGGCSGCALSGSCRVCRPLAKAYQNAKAPLETYCRHGLQGVPE